jgi:hypothetical protein
LNPGSLKIYAGIWRSYTGWCRAEGRDPTDQASIEAYIASPCTAHLAAISINQRRCCLRSILLHPEHRAQVESAGVGPGPVAPQAAPPVPAVAPEAAPGLDPLQAFLLEIRTGHDAALTVARARHALVARALDAYRTNLVDDVRLEAEARFGLPPEGRLQGTGLALDLLRNVLGLPELAGQRTLIGPWIDWHEVAPPAPPVPLVPPPAPAAPPEEPVPAAVPPATAAGPDAFASPGPAAEAVVDPVPAAPVPVIRTEDLAMREETVRLVALGRSRGYLTFDDVTTALPADLLEALLAQAEAAGPACCWADGIMEILCHEGIDLVDHAPAPLPDPPAGEAAGEAATGTADEDEDEEDEADGDAEPVRINGHSGHPAAAGPAPVQIVTPLYPHLRLAVAGRKLVVASNRYEQRLEAWLRRTLGSSRVEWLALPEQGRVDSLIGSLATGRPLACLVCCSFLDHTTTVGIKTACKKSGVIYLSVSKGKQKKLEEALGQLESRLARTDLQTARAMQ